MIGDFLFGLELFFLRITARFGHVPKNYRVYHHTDCTPERLGQFYNCSEECPSHMYEKTGVWKP